MLEFNIGSYCMQMNVFFEGIVTDLQIEQDRVTDRARAYKPIRCVLDFL